MEASTQVCTRVDFPIPRRRVFSAIEETGELELWLLRSTKGGVQLREAPELGDFRVRVVYRQEPRLVVWSFLGVQGDAFQVSFELVPARAGCRVQATVVANKAMLGRLSETIHSSLRKLQRLLHRPARRV